MQGTVQAAGASIPARKARRLPRRRLKWSEILRAPVHDFPIRDEILHHCAPPLPGLNILEIGPGSGFTAFTLSPAVEHLTLVDYAEATLSDLERKLGRYKNIRFMEFDISKPGFRAGLGQTYDFAFGLDMFEYVPDDVQGLKNLKDVLNPGGVMLLTFPNFAPPRGDGVTWYMQRRELERSLGSAGFSSWEILCVVLRPYSSAIFAIMHEWPLWFYRRLRKRNNAEQPQTYEKTWAFQNRGTLRVLKPILHIYWEFLGAMIRLGGPPFKAQAAPEDLHGYQLVVVASA